MSVAHIIASSDDSLKLDTQYFVEELQKRWPEARVHYITDPRANSLLQFRVDPSDEDYGILGDFAASGVSFQTHSMSGITAFVQWFRAIVPSTYELILYDTPLSHEPIKLTQDITEADLIAGFKIPFDMSKYE